MYLLILESIGTSELLLIGIVALIFLGPRKLPEYARKIGKITSEFRGTASEFKETWQREANFEEEMKSLNLNELERESEDRSAARAEPVETVRTVNLPNAPAISEVDPERLEALKRAAEDKDAAAEDPQAGLSPTNDKKNWL